MAEDLPYDYDMLKENRLERFDKHNIDNTPERLLVREQVQKKRLERLVRNKEF